MMKLYMYEIFNYSMKLHAYEIKLKSDYACIELYVFRISNHYRERKNILFSTILELFSLL